MIDFTLPYTDTPTILAWLVVSDKRIIKDLFLTKAMWKNFFVKKRTKQWEESEELLF